jgi:UDP-N-acetyl-2-amino-2-deoxyglucuronate dehydrogenase
MTGAQGTLTLEHDRLGRMDLRSPVAGLGHAEAPADTTASASSPIVSDASAHARVIEDFVHAIKTNGVPTCDGREGRRSVAVIQAIYESAKSGRPVAPAV